MKTRVRSRRLSRGFSLVELLAVVLVLAVLAGVAVPLYVNSRKDSAARACKANIATIAAGEAAYAARFGQYASDTAGTAWKASYVAATTTGSAPTGGLVGAPEGLAAVPTCPLAGKSYTVKGATSGPITIECADKAQHATDTGGASTSWESTLSAAGVDKTNAL